MLFLSVIKGVEIINRCIYLLKFYCYSNVLCIPFCKFIIKITCELKTRSMVNICAITTLANTPTLRSYAALMLSNLVVIRRVL